MIFVMKFQAAAMGRADTPENEREDFSLYVDEFQNFATESFATILSEARKYRLSLVLANQFMTQLTDQIREAILGNIGTVISGRIGITDAEILVKKFSPTFDAEDLTKLPNFQTIASVMINNVPSAAFSMQLVPPMGQSNPQLRDALKKLSAAKYGRPRADVEREIFARLGAGDAAKKAKMDALKQAQQERMAALQANGARPGAPAAPGVPPQPAAGGASFLDEWLAKRQQLASNPAPQPVAPPNPAFGPTVPAAAPVGPQAPSIAPAPKPDEVSVSMRPKQPNEAPKEAAPTQSTNPEDIHKLHVREPGQGNADGVSIKLR